MPVVRAPILEHPAQYQLKYQVTSAAEMTGQNRAIAHSRPEASLHRDALKAGYGLSGMTVIPQTDGLVSA